MGTEDINLWLPSKFLSGQKFNVENENETQHEVGVNFPDEFPYEFDSFAQDYAPGSPVESANIENEADGSEEDNLLAGLTHPHDCRALPVSGSTVDLTEMKKATRTGSPQSIIGGIGIWPGRSDGSSTGSSQFPSPPTPPFLDDCDSWDRIYEVAGKLARLKMNYERNECGPSNHPVNNLNNYCRGGPSPLQCQNLGFAPMQPNLRLCSTIDQNRQAGRLQSQRSSDYGREENLYWLRRRQQNKQIQNIDRSVEKETARGGCEWSSCAPLHIRHQNQPSLLNCPAECSSAHGRSIIKRESSGTGVFLPRSYGDPLPPSKISGCSTTLPVHDTKKSAVSASFDGVLSLSYDAKIQYRSSVNHEIQLPREWTY